MVTWPAIRCAIRNSADIPACLTYTTNLSSVNGGRRGQPQVAHLANAGRAHAVVELEEHARGGDHAGQKRAATPRAPEDAHAAARRLLAREPAALDVERASSVDAQDVDRIPCVHDDRVAGRDVGGAHTLRHGRGGDELVEALDHLWKV